MSLASARSLFVFAFLGCVAIMGGALYLEHVLGQQPCPLCIIQRVCVIIFGLVCLLAAVHNPGRSGQRGYAGLAGLAALAGAGTAGRQVWLQNIPADELPACLPASITCSRPCRFRKSSVWCCTARLIVPRLIGPCWV